MDHTMNVYAKYWPTNTYMLNIYKCINGTYKLHVSNSLINTYTELYIFIL